MRTIIMREYKNKSIIIIFIGVFKSGCQFILHTDETLSMATNNLIDGSSHGYQSEF